MMNKIHKVINKKILILSFLILGWQMLWATSAKIQIDSPKHNSVQSEQTLWITGQCKNSQALKINNSPVSLQKNGQFKYKTYLENPHQDHFYTLKALGTDQQEVETLLRVFYKTKTKKEQVKKIAIPPKKIKEETPAPNPEITIIYPAANSRHEEAKITLSGFSTNCVHIKIKNTLYPVHPSGHFQVPYTLSKHNKKEHISITAISKLGKSKTFTQQVYFVSPKPMIKFSKAPKFKHVSSKTITFKGQTQFCESLWANQEKIKLNKDGTFKYSRKLNKANEDVVIIFKAINKNGRAHIVSKTHKLVNPKKAKITLHSPPTSYQSVKDHVVFKGKVEHAHSLWLGQIEIPLNEDGYFEYKLKLTQANQEKQVILKAENEFGKTDIIVCQLYYSPSKPSLKISSHGNYSQSQDNSVTIKGQALNAYAVDINNKTVSLDEFGYFTHTLILKNPNQDHKVIISTYSDHEEEAQSTHYIHYSPLKNPVLALESPANKLQTTHEYVQFKGQAKNCQQLYINNEAVIPDEAGYFTKQVELPENKTYTFKIEAIGANHKIIQLQRSITRKALPETLSKAEKNTQQKRLQKKVMHLATNPNLAYLDKKVTLELSDADIRDVLMILAQKSNLNIVTDKTLSGKVNVSLNDVSIKQAIELILGSHGLSYRIDDKTLLVGDEKNLKKSQFIETRIIALNNLETSDVKTLIEKQLDEGESLDEIPQQRKVILNADSDKIERLVTLINTMDEERIPQIVLEAQILEISKSATKELGVEWIHSLGLNYSLNFSESKFLQSNNKAQDIESAINFLQEQGQAKILAKPRIQVIDQKSAQIFIGDQIPVPSQSSDSSGKTTTSYDYMNVGITLKLQPFINARLGEIKIKIQPEISYSTQQAAAPTIKTRKVDTTVFVKDGQMVLIGGLFNTQDSENHKGLPGLSQLPFLKKVFGNGANIHHENELMIAITPKIVYLDQDKGIY